MGKRKKYSSDTKLTAVIESFVSGNMSATAAEHGVHISMLDKWKKKLLAEGSKIYEGNKKNDTDIQHRLERIIGRQAIQIDMLKKTQEYIS